MTSPFDHTVAVPFRDEARVMRAIVRERGHWLSPMFRDLPLPPDKLPKETHPQTDRESIARGYQIRSNRVIEAAPEPVEVALRPEEPAPRPAMRPAVPRVSKLDPDKKAEALARVTARAEELARAEAEREEARRIKLETKEKRRWNSVKAAQSRYNERMASESAKFAARPIPNPHSAAPDSPPPPPEPTLSDKELREQAKTAAAVARFQARQAKKNAKDKIRQAQRTELRRAEKVAALKSKVDTIAGQIEALRSDPALGPVFELYVNTSLRNAARHDRRKGVDPSEAKVAERRHKAHVAVVEAMKADPDYLDKWNQARKANAKVGTQSYYERVRSDPAKLAAYNQIRSDYYYRKAGKPLDEETRVAHLEAKLQRIFKKAQKEAVSEVKATKVTPKADPLLQKAVEVIAATARKKRRDRSDAKQTDRRARVDGEVAASQVIVTFTPPK